MVSNCNGKKWCEKWIYSRRRIIRVKWWSKECLMVCFGRKKIWKVMTCTVNVHYMPKTHDCDCDMRKIRICTHIKWNESLEACAIRIVYWNFYISRYLRLVEANAERTTHTDAYNWIKKNVYIVKYGMSSFVMHCCERKCKKMSDSLLLFKYTSKINA